MLIKYTIHPSTTDQDKKTIYSWYMIVFSLIRCKCLLPYRTDDRQFEVFSNVRWIVLLLLELIGAAFFFAFERVKGSNTFGCCLFDCICLISMFFIYKINEAASSQQPDNKVPLLNCLHLQPQSKQKLLERKDKKVRQLKVDNSIYNMALYTLIDPVVIEEMQTNYMDQSDGKT